MTTAQRPGVSVAPKLCLQWVGHTSRSIGLVCQWLWCSSCPLGAVQSHVRSAASSRGAWARTAFSTTSGAAARESGDVMGDPCEVSDDSVTVIARAACSCAW